MVNRPAAHVLTGTRIRERRLALARRQADVARAVGISAAYLNLIEHNRRPVGPALIGRLAEVLAVPAAELEAGREEARLAALREAAARLPAIDAELAHVAEFAARFPGWAAVLAATAHQAEALERRLVALSDRMAQDPYLSTTLHEVLSAVTALRATAAILSEGGVTPEWSARFHANLDADSQRLSATAQALAAYLDGFEAEGTIYTPREEVEAWMAAGHPPPEEALDLASDAGRALARAHLARIEAERTALPDATLARVAAETPEPMAIAAATGAPLDLVLRRLALLRPPGFQQAGLVTCDGAGALILCRPAPGFPLARHGEGCPLLPLYQVLAQPQTALRGLVETAEGTRFETLAYAVRRQPLGTAGPVLTEALMLIQPAPNAPGPALPIGPTCRICPRGDCPARREPSILAPI